MIDSENLEGLQAIIKDKTTNLTTHSSTLLSSHHFLANISLLFASVTRYDREGKKIVNYRLTPLTHYSKVRFVPLTL